MNPKDADIRSNLKFARKLVEGSSEQESSRWYEMTFFFLRRFLSTSEITFLLSALYFAAMIFLTLGVILKARRKIFYYFSVFFFVLFIIVLPSFINAIQESGFQKKAVIMVKETEVRFEPDDDATVHFKLYEGEVIQITRSESGWHQIRRYDGKMGWLKGNIFEII